MTGKEYIRTVPNAKTAVLFIHGIMGTPDHFNDLIASVPDSFSIHNLVLDGHSKGVRDFSKTSMKNWEAQADTAFHALASTHERVIVVGHSMGTLLSVDLAVNYPDKVPLLFLLNVPLIPRVTLRAVRHSLRVLFECVREDRADEVAARAAYGIEIDRRLWLYIGWVPRFLELFKKARDTRYKLPQINVRCLAFQSHHDELVSNRSKKILRKHPNIITTSLTESSHYLYAENDKKNLLRSFSAECKKLSK